MSTYSWTDVVAGQTADPAAINALGNQVEKLSAQPVWNALTYANGCASYGGFYVAGYYQDPLSRLWLKGIIKVGDSGLAQGAVAATIPTALAPAGQVPSFSRIAASANTGTGRIDVQNDGEIINNSGADLDPGAWMLIEGMTWLPGQ